MGYFAGEEAASLAVQSAFWDEHDPVQRKVLLLVHNLDGGFQVSDAVGKFADLVFVFHDFVMEDFFQEGHRGLLVVVGKPGTRDRQVSE